jgi:DMSO/TMAO reductase YedYZ heme-binding membrane subunit
MGTAAPSAAPPRRPGRPTRLSGAAMAVLAAAAGLVIVFTTDQILPATSDHQAQLRIWLESRASGFMALLLLTFQVMVGLVLSHPTNKSTWRLSKLLFPWHDHAWVFTIAFGAAHVISISMDHFAKVGVLGALIPGLSEFRTVPAALGTLSMYALLITGLTARMTKLLPTGWWLKLHRLSLGVLGLAWAHGILSGTDTFDAIAIYGVTFVGVALAATYRYWVFRSGRPTFSTSLAEEATR